MRSLREDILGGTLGAIMVVPIILGCGFIIAQPLGAGWGTAGVMAAFAASILVGFFRGLHLRGDLHLCSPKATYAAMISVLTAQVAALPEFGADFPTPEAAAQALLAIGFMIALISGVVQFLLGAGGLGGLIKYVPQPVVAGFVNGFALHIVLMQLPALFGRSDFAALRLALEDSSSLLIGPALLSALTVVLIMMTSRVSRIVPAALVGLAGGTLLYAAAARLWPEFALGSTIGQLPSGLPFTWQPPAMHDVLASPSLHRYLPDLIASAATLALVSSLQSLLSATSADAMLGTRHDGNRELKKQGFANLLSGLAGGMPTGGSPTVTRAAVSLGARTNVANLAHAVALLVMLLLAAPLIGAIPVPAMAAVVVITSLGMLDEWTRDLFRQLRRSEDRAERSTLMVNLAVVVTVTLLVVEGGTLVALTAGMAISFALFVRQSGHSMVRRILRAQSVRSRTMRGRDAIETLNRHGHAILVVELQGPIFFGSVDQVIASVAQHHDAEIVILDFRRVSNIDATGAMELKRLDRDLTSRNGLLFLATLPIGHPVRKMLAPLGFGNAEREGRVFSDRNHALSAAEDVLLQRHAATLPPDHHEIDLAEVDILASLSEGQRERLKQRMLHIAAAPGTRIIAEGERGDCMFMLVAGRVTVSRTHADSRGTIVLGSYRPGIVFGEMAMLSGKPRAADVVAETRAAYWELTQEAFDGLKRDDPELYMQLMRNIALNLVHNVSALNQMILEMEG